MSDIQLTEDELSFILKLREKYEGEGEDFRDHLEGILYSDFVNYWDYIGIDALLNLQKPKTKYPDEMTFIIYHQITELYFKIIIHELESIGYAEEITVELFLAKLKRINSYFHFLIQSFSGFMGGMEHGQFMKFRTALTPASGFQSIQYRLIELWATKFRYLLSHNMRGKFEDSDSIKDMYPFLYWTDGATEKASGKKTLTLRQFEKKYRNLITRKGKEFFDKNLLVRFQSLSKKDQQNKALIAELRLFDINANVNWPLAHYRQAAKYLQKGSMTATSTGGTNWQEYLPPKFQRRIFYPQLWSQEEKDNWGKSWVMSEILDSES